LRNRCCEIQGRAPPLANVDTAVRKLLEIANGLEADHAGRLQIGTVNSQFVSAGGTHDEYSAAVKMAVKRGYVIMHPSGAYLSFTQEAADLFAETNGLETAIRRTDSAAQRPLAHRTPRRRQLHHEVPEGRA
jgi:hypothetical protein